MNSSEVLEVGKEGIVVMLEIALPILIVALIVGLAISLLQALTQMQEATLSFVPKIIAISLALILFIPMMGGRLIDYTESLYDKIANIEKGGEEE